MSSSIDDEFASLFLPDLELLGSVNNNSVDSSRAVDQRLDDFTPTTYDVNQFTMASHNHIPSIPSEPTPHWLQHYDRINKNFGVLRAPFMPFAAGQQHQMALQQAPSPSVAFDNALAQYSQYADDLSGNVNVVPAFPGMPAGLGAAVGAAGEPNGALVKQETEAVFTPAENIDTHTEKKRPQKKKKEESSEHTYLLLLKAQAPDESATLMDLHGRTVRMDASGEIDGRFLYTESDLQDASTVKISCYRRNYIKILFEYSFDNVPTAVSVPGREIMNLASFRINVYATTNFSDDKINLIVDESKKTPKSGAVTYLDVSSHEVPAAAASASAMDGASRQFVLKRTQFRNATPNSNRSGIFQNYYYIVVEIAAKTTSGEEFPLVFLKSVPIKVRGRNPSFYNNRNDILIVKESLPIQERNPDDRPADDRAARFSPGVQSLAKQESSHSEDTVNSAIAQEKDEYSSSSQSQQQDKPATADVPSDPKSKSPANYEYFPLSNVYYLPPVDAHYFPHGIHHPRQSSIMRNRRQSDVHEDRLPIAEEFMSSDHNANGSDKFAQNRFIKMRLMNILNNDNNMIASRSQGRYFDSSSGGVDEL